MPISVQIAGLATIKVGQEGCANNQLEVLGYTVNGARIRTEGYFDEVHGDEYGGDAGPPIELVYLGERAVVTLELSKWDYAVANKIGARLYGKTTGQIGQVGTPVFAAGKAYRLVIDVAAEGAMKWDFLRAVPREPIEVNKGTRHSVLMIAFECYPKQVDGTAVVYRPFSP